MYILARDLLHTGATAKKGTECVPDHVPAKTGDNRPRLTRQQLAQLMAEGTVIVHDIRKDGPAPAPEVETTAVGQTLNDETDDEAKEPA